MHDTYFVEERSGVIGLGPLTNSPDLYYRRSKTNWHSFTSWLHLIICLLSVPLIIWNLYLLMDTIDTYTTTKIDATDTGTQLTAVQPLGYLLIFCAIWMNLLAGLFALVTEAACFSDKLAKFLYVIAYLSIAITVYVVIYHHSLLNILWLILLLLFMVSFGFGFWRFTIISAIYLNEEGPVWFKPLLYGCLAAIPLLTTGSQCRDAKNTYGCFSNDLFGGRYMYNDFYSFTIMAIIAIISAIPYLLGVPHNQ